MKTITLYALEDGAEAFGTVEVDGEDVTINIEDESVKSWIQEFLDLGYDPVSVAGSAVGSYGRIEVEDDDDEPTDLMDLPEDDGDGADDESEDEDALEPLADGTITKSDEDRQILFGWAYVTHDKDGNVVVDKSGEFVDDIEEIEKAAYQFVMKSRKGDTDHDMMKSSEMVESVVFTPEKIAAMGIPEGTLPLGWWVGFHIPDKDQWQIAKTRKAFSIYGKAVRKEIED